MRARAPGKLVLSGAYAVLRGAPAVVTAVDRFVYADTAIESTFRTPEFQAALEALDCDEDPHPAFDASELRKEGRKLGLGSSAAILVASLLARLGRPSDGEAARARLFELAREAHRTAQGGGSGIDVAATLHGGTLLAERKGSQLAVEPVTLPKELCFEVWSLPEPASTAEFVARVFGAEAAQPTAFSSLFQRQLTASRAAATALRAAKPEAFVWALRAQCEALRELGGLAQVPIVVPAGSALHADLAGSACFLPAGAGGGDVSLYVGKQASPPHFRERAARAGFELLDLRLGAPGASLLE